MNTARKISIEEKYEKWQLRTKKKGKNNNKKNNNKENNKSDISRIINNEEFNKLKEIESKYSFFELDNILLKNKVKEANKMLKNAYLERSMLATYLSFFSFGCIAFGVFLTFLVLHIFDKSFSLVSSFTAVIGILCALGAILTALIDINNWNKIYRRKH